MEKRLILWFMLVFLVICNTLVTLNVTIAIISMVRPTKSGQKYSNETTTVLCPNTTFQWSQDNRDKFMPQHLPTEDTYEWSDYEKRMVLSAYHGLGWMSILPGSVLAQKYGSKIVLGYSLFISSVLSSLIPFAAGYGARVVMYIRMIQGLFSFVAVPGGYMSIVGNWSSRENRGKFISVVLVGASLALGFGSYVFGYIGQYLHWKFIFHFTSLFGIVWTVLWYFLVHDYPDKHPTISDEEKIKILKSIKQAVTDENIPIPWKEIFTSVPFIVYCLLIGAMICNFFLLITFMPSYLHDVYGLSSSQAGIIVSLPQFVCGILSFLFGWLTDYLVKTCYLSTTNTRKLITTVGSITASIPLIIMAYTKCNLDVIIICYILSTIQRSVGNFGAKPSVIDMSPKFCGVLQGIAGSMSEVITVISAAGMSFLTKLLPTEEFWRVVFILTGVYGLIASILFLIWGTAELQSWNQGPKRFRNRRADVENESLKPMK